MNDNLAPYAEIVNLLCQWKESLNADNLFDENSPEIMAIRQYGIQHITKAISAILTFADAEVRCNAIDALEFIVPDDVLIDLLIPSLSDPSSGIRWTVCELLRGCPDARVVLPLVKVLQTDPDPNVRLVAAEALIADGDERAIPALAHTEKHDKGKDYEDRTIANAAHEAIVAIEKRTNQKRESQK
jgi:HEAT repeat protein